MLHALTYNNGAGGSLGGIIGGLKEAAAIAKEQSAFPWYAYDAMVANSERYATGYTVDISRPAFNNLFKNFTNSYSINWRKDSLLGSQPAAAVFSALNNLALKSGIGDQIYSYTGPKITVPAADAAGYPAWPADPFPSAGALVWALVHGYIQITPQAAAAIQTDDASTGIIPASWWMEFGKPIAEMAAIVVGGSLLSTAGTAGSGASATLAPTSLTVAAPTASTLTPVVTGTTDLGSALGSVGGVSGVATAVGSSSGGLLSSLTSELGGISSSTLQTAGGLLAAAGAGQGGSAGSTPANTYALAPVNVTAKKSSLLLWLLLLAGVLAGGRALLAFG